MHIFQSRSKEFEASSRRWPTADPTTNGEARVTRQVGVRSYEVESDGKSCIRNRKNLEKAADDAKSSHGIENYAAPNIDLPINKPHVEEPTQHKETPKPLQLPSSSPWLIVKLRSMYQRPTVAESQYHQRDSRTLLDFNLTWWTLTLILQWFFSPIFSRWPCIFLVFSLSQKGLDSCHDHILCTLVSYDYVHMEILCMSELRQGMAYTVRGVVWLGCY